MTAKQFNNLTFFNLQSQFTDREMAQWAKCKLCRCEDLSLDQEHACGTSGLFGWDGRYWWESCNSHSLTSLRHAAGGASRCLESHTSGKWRPTHVYVCLDIYTHTHERALTHTYKHMGRCVHTYTHRQWERQTDRWQVWGCVLKLEALRNLWLSPWKWYTSFQSLNTKCLAWKLKTCLSSGVYKLRAEQGHHGPMSKMERHFKSLKVAPLPPLLLTGYQRETGVTKALCQSELYFTW